MTARRTTNGPEFDAVCRCAYHRAFPVGWRAEAKRSMRRRERHEARAMVRGEVTR